MITFELTIGAHMEIEHSLFVDKFSIIMALIVGIIGSAICLYAIGYIPEYHQHHKEVKDRRKYFAFLIYLFLSAMFGIVFSNNLIWIFFFWEITTICSALLIGYRNDKQSVESMFRALKMNLLGGLVFAIGLVYLYSSSHVMELDKLIKLDTTFALLPAVCIAFAGLVKSAQFPFSSWLTGAMVAPTPVSALLHSSTMVKAGVYIILRVAPAMQNTVAAKMLMFIGGLSFPDHRIAGHFPEQCQEGACLLNHIQPRPDRGLRGNQHVCGDLVGPAAHHLSRSGEVPPLSLRRDR